MISETEKQDIRLLLFGNKEDAQQDDLIALLHKQATSQLELAIARIKKAHGQPQGGGIPKDLRWILTELVIARYNRIGSEGMTAEAVEGHSVHYEDATGVERYERTLAEYYRPTQDGRGSYGTVRGYR